MTLEEFTDYVKSVSTQVATEPTAQPITDATFAIEVLLPVILRKVVRRVAQSDRIYQLFRDYQVELTGQSASLPVGVEEEFVESFQITDTLQTMEFYHEPQFTDFSQNNDVVLPKFTIKDRKIYARYADGDSNPIPDGTNVVLTAVTIPQIPASATDEIVVNDDVMDDCLAMASSIIRGEIPLTALGIRMEK